MPHRLLTVSARTELETLRARLPPGWVLDSMPLPTEDQLVKAIGDVSILLTGNVPVSARVVESAPQLRLIQAPTGYNHIDAEAATRHGVCVANSGVNFVSVAELTVFFMLYLARGMSDYTRRAPSPGWWSNVPPTVELAGKSLGLVGFGHIGREVASRAKALDMRVLAYDPYVPEEQLRDAGVEPSGLPELLGASDFLSLHLPLTPKTRGLIGEGELARMKPTAYLINTARGGLVDDAALARALGEGRLAGAALDVLTNEPPDPANPLLKLDRVLITPHVGGRTKDANRRSWELVVENIWRVDRGEVPRNLVNPDVLKGGARLG